MLFTITYTGENAGDLGYLLHKNPARPQTVELSFGRAHVFYPELSPGRCTAALLLDIDPLDLARGRPGSAGGGLFDYVNDRPYVSSSFMSTAVSRAYGTAMAGRCEKRQALADAPLDLSAELTMLPCRGDAAMLEQVFGPLGYAVEWEGFPLDERFPPWGGGPYVNLRLRGTVRLRDLLRHIYVLIPVFDLRKHYWIGEAEIGKLLLHGEGWLENHPAKVFITRRYFKKLGRLTALALDRLDNGEGGTGEELEEEPDKAAALNPAGAGSPAPDGGAAPLNLNTLRLLAVLGELKASGAARVIDLGCGEGRLLQFLAREKQFTAIEGTDVSVTALDRAAERLRLKDRSGPAERIKLFQSSLTYRDKRLQGRGAAAAAVEVIEHLDESRLPAFAQAVLGDPGFKTVVITTPNAEYNPNYGLAPGRFRHGDHRFEWTRAEFRAWAGAAAARYGYEVRYEDIGPWDEERGSPSQMGVFTA